MAAYCQFSAIDEWHYFSRNFQLSPTREKSDESEEVDVLPHLTNLRRLDVSFEKDTSAFNTIIGPEPWQNFHLTNFIDKLPHLVSLDISGGCSLFLQRIRLWWSGNSIIRVYFYWTFLGKEYIKEDDMIAFLRNHAKLKFLGLANTILCQSDVFLNPQNSDFRCDLKVSIVIFLWSCGGYQNYEFNCRLPEQLRWNKW